MTEHKNKQKLNVRTFGNFDVYDSEMRRIYFSRKLSKQLLAYLIDRQGYPVTTKDIIKDVLEREITDLNAAKYVSALSKELIKDLGEHGFDDIVIREWNTLRIEKDRLDCDLYRLLSGERSSKKLFHGEYMKEYSWAEETCAELFELAEE